MKKILLAMIVLALSLGAFAGSRTTYRCEFDDMKAKITKDRTGVGYGVMVTKFPEFVDSFAAIKLDPKELGEGWNGELFRNIRGPKVGVRIFNQEKLMTWKGKNFFKAAFVIENSEIDGVCRE